VATVSAPTAVQQSEPTTASTRKIAVLIGLLFLTATVTFAIAEGLIRNVLDRPDFLTGASEDTNALAAAAVLAFVQGVAIVGIAVPRRGSRVSRVHRRRARGRFEQPSSGAASAGRCRARWRHQFRRTIFGGTVRCGRPPSSAA
jgi:hypothetical protein